MDAVGLTDPPQKCVPFVDQVGPFTITMLSMSCSQLSVSMSQHGAYLLLVFVILEEYQKLCIQIPDGNNGVIPGRVPGSPDLPAIYPLPYPGQNPGQIPQYPGPNPGQIPGQFPFPGQLPLQPRPGMVLLSFVLFTFTACLKSVRVHR